MSIQDFHCNLLPMIFLVGFCVKNFFQETQLLDHMHFLQETSNLSHYRKFLKIVRFLVLRVSYEFLEGSITIFLETGH